LTALSLPELTNIHDSCIAAVVSVTAVWSKIPFVCIIPSLANIWRWSWTLGRLGRSMWISRWRRLANLCGSVGGLLVLHGACSRKWFIGSTSLSFGHPSPLHV
jgi:hypothetical protein